MAIARRKGRRAAWAIHAGTSASACVPFAHVVQASGYRPPRNVSVSPTGDAAFVRSTGHARAVRVEGVHSGAAARPHNHGEGMNRIIYIIGLVVVIGAVLAFFGLR